MIYSSPLEKNHLAGVCAFSLVSAILFQPACWAIEYTAVASDTKCGATQNIDSSANDILALEVAPASLPDINAISSAESTAPTFAVPDHLTALQVNGVKLALADSSTTLEPATLRGGVAIEPTAAARRVDELTREILLKVIELEKFNVHYNLEVAKQGRWKGLRYAAFQEVNSGTMLTGAIIGTAERGVHLHTPGLAHPATLENGAWIPMVGNIIGASAAALEFWINEYHDLQAHKKGFSPGLARKHVEQLRDEINNLLAERDALTKIEADSARLSGHAEIDQAEGRVLSDMRDEGLLEFERFHITGRKILAYQQMQYMFDFCKFTTNAVGYEFSFLSIHRHRRPLNFDAGVMWDISGPLFMAGPIVSRLVAKGVGECHRKWLKPYTAIAEQTAIDKLSTDQHTLAKLCRETNCTPDIIQAQVDRSSAIYTIHDKTFRDGVSSRTLENARAKLTSTENVAAGIFVGGCRLSNGILFTIPGFYHNYNTHTDLANHVTNTDLFVSSVISIPANSFAMLDTMRIQIQAEIERRKLKKAGRLRGQIAALWLKQLDEMENKLKAAKASG